MAKTHPNLRLSVSPTAPVPKGALPPGQPVKTKPPVKPSGSKRGR